MSFREKIAKKTITNMRSGILAKNLKFNTVKKFFFSKTQREKGRVNFIFNFKIKSRLFELKIFFLDLIDVCEFPSPPPGCLV